MKNLRIVALVLAVPILVSAALGQADTAQTASEAPSAALAAARCQYTPAEESCHALSIPEPADNKTDDTTLQAQTPRHMPGPPFRPHRPMGGPRYRYPGNGQPGMWATEGNSRHAVIGGLIGFGLGAALGASADTNVRGRVAASLVVGSLGALIGAVAGYGVPSYHSHNQRPWDDKTDEDASLKRKKQESTNPAVGD
jgi:hypothetical protein